MLITWLTSFVTNDYGAQCFSVKKKLEKERIFFPRSSKQLVFRDRMAKKIKNIRKMFDEIKADQVFLQLVKRDHQETRGPSTMGVRETHSLVNKDDVKSKII